MSSRFVLGETNVDGLINAADIDNLQCHVCLDLPATGNSSVFALEDGTPGANPFFDLNTDTVVDQTDVDRLVEGVLGTAYGDANLDGIVNTIDVDILVTSLLQGGATG